jgi:Dullard-like phosphatase family protein
MWGPAGCDPRFALDRSEPRRFGQDVSNLDPMRRGGGTAWAAARFPYDRDPSGMIRGMYGRPGVSQATPERKPQTPVEPTADYETPEKEAVSPRALSPKLDKRLSERKVDPQPSRENRSSNRKQLSTPAKPPRGSSATRGRLEAKSDALVQRASRDLMVRTPRPKPPRSPRPLSPRSQRVSHGDVRNPFRQELPEEPDQTDVEQMWDCRVNMYPLDLATLPEVELITPSLRNALRFLTFNPVPPHDWRETAMVEGHIVPMEPFLPPMRPGTRLTLVLDLDETLMHCQKNGDHPQEKPDMFLHFTDSQTTGYVNFRPHAAEVLSLIAKWDLCEVVVFTASTQAYADAVLNVLDPHQTLIHHRLYRQHCVHANGGYFKDLRALGRSMDHIVLVDNSPVSLAMNPHNGIPIKSWLKNPDDTQLRHLFELVKELVFSDETVQSVLEERYNLPGFLESLRNTL